MKKTMHFQNYLGLTLLILSITISSFASSPYSSVEKPLPVTYVTTTKPITVHVTGNFSLCSSCAVLFTYSLDITFEANLLSNPPKIRVISVHGSVCWAGSSVCGNFREANIVNNAEGDDTTQIEYEALTTTPPTEVANALDNPLFLEHLRAKIIESQNN